MLVKTNGFHMTDCTILAEVRSHLRPEADVACVDGHELIVGDQRPLIVLGHRLTRAQPHLISHLRRAQPRACADTRTCCWLRLAGDGVTTEQRAHG